MKFRGNDDLEYVCKNNGILSVLTFRMGMEKESRKCRVKSVSNVSRM